MMFWKSLYNLRTRESKQLKTVLELYEMEIHQKISMPNYQKAEDDGEEKCRSETPIAKLSRQTLENRNRSSGQERPKSTSTVPPAVAGPARRPAVDGFVFAGVFPDAHKIEHAPATRPPLVSQ